jgi:hypothetical protein
MTSPSATVALPIGHYLGVHGGVHLVRTGEHDRHLDEEGFRAWVLAHGVPDEHAPAPQGPLIVRVVPGSRESEDFARTHRLRPLLVGLGADPLRPGWYGLGLPGQVLTVVPQFAFEVWQWAPAAADLWEFCRDWAEREEPDNERSEPRAVLEDLLYCLPLLLSVNAVCLVER